MKEIERLQKDGYDGIVSYNSDYDDSTPPSKRYNLKIIKDNIVYINRNNLTYCGAKTKFKRWVKKQI